MFKEVKEAETIKQAKNIMRKKRKREGRREGGKKKGRKEGRKEGGNNTVGPSMFFIY